MDKIITEIKKIINENIKEYLPKVTSDDLEEGGMIYYMNANNGTEFDWYVNDRICNFMVFYNDEANLGAAKASVYTDGEILLYLFNEQGNNRIKDVDLHLDVTKDDMLRLAVKLKMNADEKKAWNESIERIDSDTEPSEEAVTEFIDNMKYYENSIETKKMFNKLAVVSKRILEDGYKVGYMRRVAPHEDEDSGWTFFAGNESPEYAENSGNFHLAYVNYIAQNDPSIIKYLTSPYVINLVKISEDTFEEDNGQESYIEKWE